MEINDLYTIQAAAAELKKYNSELADELLNVYRRLSDDNGFFPVLRLHRFDIDEALDGGWSSDDFTDEEMRTLALKMGSGGDAMDFFWDILAYELETNYGDRRSVKGSEDYLEGSLGTDG
jgi:hypothetical protein